MTEHNELCIYEIGTTHLIEVVEYAPTLFKELRKKAGFDEDYLFRTFAPIHNIQAIHNFFTGSGKSSSFFFFSDNKTFVLKTLKDSEKKLLLDQGILENYYNFLMENDETLLSKFYGVYTIKI